ncbi:MAG TPA: PQQ-binding-like beta-propeller repeat protein [Bryobacteraceae bacterium]|nr:PQQ-binding-like beta-propeller repeat protein [Bryobacteraceae bacterium]
MKSTGSFLIATLALARVAAADWPTFGADAQRTGWARGERILNKNNVGTLELKWKLHLDNAPRELTSLSAPIVADQIKTSRGIKEFVIVAGSSDTLFAIDADTGKLVWSKTFGVTSGSAPKPNTLCPDALNATPAVQNGRPKVVYAISSDGKLHALTVVNGEDRFAPKPLVPAFSKNWSLNIFDNVLYTAISQRCNGATSGVYSIDLHAPDEPIRSFLAGRPGIWGRAGVTISASGTVFAETGDGPYDPADGQFADTFLALSKRLELADYYTPSNREWLTRKDLDMGNISPVVFSYKGKEYLVGAGKEGRLFLLDTAALGGDTHREPMYRSPLITNEEVNHAGRGFWGSFASWEDPHGTRWIFAPAWGPAHPGAPAFPTTNGDAPHGSVMAFRVETQQGPAMLLPAWMSRDLNVPEPPVIAGGVVFVLSSGEDVRQVDAAGNGMGTAERLAGSRKAVLYALDAESGKELFNSGDTLTSFTHFGGIAVSNGRVFVTTWDGYVYAFGLKHEDR